MKKALKATWDSESESEEEVGTANVCFMTNTPKVNSESSFDNSGVTQEDLLNACLLYTSPSPRDRQKSRMPSSA